MLGVGERVHAGAAAVLPEGGQECACQLHLPRHQAQQDTPGQTYLMSSCLPWHQAQQDTTGQTYVSHIYPGTKHSKIPQVKHVYKYKGGVIYYFFTETFKNKYFLRKIAMISLFLQRTVAKYVENFKLKTFRIFCMPPKWARLFLTWSKENTFFLSFS